MEIWLIGTLGRGFEALRENWELGQELKSSVACLGYNIVHAVPISQDTNY